MYEAPILIIIISRIICKDLEEELELGNHKEMSTIKLHVWYPKDMEMDVLVSTHTKYITIELFN